MSRNTTFKPSAQALYYFNTKCLKSASPISFPVPFNYCSAEQQGGAKGFGTYLASNWKVVYGTCTGFRTRALIGWSLLYNNYDNLHLLHPDVTTFPLHLSTLVFGVCVQRFQLEC